jgi:hypothetical protein
MGLRLGDRRKIGAGIRASLVFGGQEGESHVEGEGLDLPGDLAGLRDEGAGGCHI